MKQPTFLNDQNFVLPLHGLRGIAVLYVVFSHLGNGGLFLFPIAHDAIGKVGVWIFFTLSAFLLTTNLSRELRTTSSKASSLIQYAVHRIFRIYPLYILILVIHLGLGDINDNDFVSHIVLAQGWAELWAIPVEFQYYLAIPAISMAVTYWQRKHVGVVLIALLIGAFVYGILQPAKIFSNELNVFPKIAPFLFGSLLAIFSSQTESIESRKFQAVIPWVCISGLFITTILYRYSAKGGLPDLFAPGLSVAIAASVVGIIQAALKTGPISTLLSSRLLVHLGKISFSFYLLHMFVIHAVQQLSGLNSVTKAWLSMVIGIACASISYAVIERPGISAGKIVSRKVRRIYTLRNERKLISENKVS